MILRQRTFCLFTLSLGCLALLLSLLFWRTTSPRADLQDREALTQDLRRIHQALEAERLFLPTFAQKWRKPLVSLNTAKIIGTTKGASPSA